MQPSANRPAPVAPAAPAPEHKPERASSKVPKGKLAWTRVVSIVAAVIVVLVVVGAALMVAHGGSSDNENKFIQKSKYQAVFLNNGQVYFGNIKDLNGNYVRMANIYYLTQGSSSSDSNSSGNSNYSLVKLGCQQIHDPLDEMVINRDQVTFWENLNDSGKVVSSIKQFQQQNPNGPDCSQVSNQTQASSSSTQGASSTNNSSNTNK